MVSKRIVKMSDDNFLEVLRVRGNSLYQYTSAHYCIDAVLNYYASAHSLSLHYNHQPIDDGDFDYHNFTSPEKLVKAVQRALNSEEMR